MDAPSTPAASPTPAAPEPQGYQKFMQDFEQFKEPAAEPAKEPKAEPAKAPTEPKAQPTPKADPKATPTPPKADKPPEGPAQLRKAYDELKAKYERETKELNEKYSTRSKEYEEVSKKRVWSEDDAKAMERHQKEAEDLRRQLAETAYERSDEFKQKFTEPYNNILKTAVAAVKQYGVEQGEGQPMRAGTPEDLQQVMSAPPHQQAAVARRIFGDNAALVLSDIREMQRLRISAEQAVSEHAKGIPERTKAERARAEQEFKAYEQATSEARSQLEKDYPEYFGKHEDPEIQGAMEKGYEFFDNLVSGIQSMSPQDRAAANAVVRARAAGFPRALVQIKQLKSKLAAVEAELAKGRASDPGSATDKGGTPPASGTKPGIAGMLDAFEK